MKRLIAIYLLFLFLAPLLPLTSAAGNTVMGITVSSTMTIGSSYSATVWLDCDESIDSFKVNLMQWNDSLLTGSNVQAGWWDWLWDPGSISGGNLTNVQAGEQSGTTDNETALTMSFLASGVGYTDIELASVQASSGGPLVPCGTVNRTVAVHPARGTLSATGYLPSQMNLTFTIGNGGDRVVIRGNTSSYPSSITDGVEIYNGTGSSYGHTENVSGGDTWYYSAYTYHNDTGLSSLTARTASATTPVTKMGIDAESVTINTVFDLRFWLDGFEEVDSFKIPYVNWTASMVTVNEVLPGWWNWAFDNGTINNIEGYVYNMQAGNLTGTSVNNTAFYFNMTADTIGTCSLTFDGVLVGCEGPYVDVVTYDNEFTIHPDNEELVAEAHNTTQINLTFSLGAGADSVLIRGSTSSYPLTTSSGSLVYSGSGTSYAHSGLPDAQTWYYSMWSYNATEGLYSIIRQQATAMTPSSNRAPTIGTPIPANGSTGESLDLAWVVSIRDPDGNLFDYTIESSSNHTISGTDESNGTKFLMLSSLNYSTEYTIWVNVTDGMYWTREWFTFTTQSEAGDAGYGVDVIRIYVSNDAAVEYDDITFLIMVTDPDTRLFQTGIANSIYISIMHVNGTVIESLQHPDEVGNGLYIYTLSSLSLSDIGEYIAYATVTFNLSTYADAVLFRIKWDTYNNISRLTQRVGEIIFLGQYERSNYTRMLMYRLNELDMLVQTAIGDIEEKSLLDELTTMTLGEIFKTIIMVLVLIGFLILASAFYGQRRARRLVRMLQPTSIADNVMFGGEPVYTRGRGEMHLQRNRR